MAKKQFKAESKRLLDLMINSIYTHKEIFLRELISNASDAEDKLAYKALTDDQVPVDRKDLKITIVPDKEMRTLTVSDNGVGMTREELENNLGTIAKSGSFQFKQDLAKEEKGEDIDVIGQFGVGFYSAFMVADHVTVVSRAYGSDEAWMWQSDGADGYTVTQCEKDAPGSDVIMHLKANADEENYDQYLETYKLQELIKKYSDYIRYPIVMEVEDYRQKEKPADAGDDYKPEWETVKEWKTINSMVPRLIPCNSSPVPANCIKRKKSTIECTAVSDCPTPTVSTNMLSNPAASHKTIVSRVLRATPPKDPAEGEGLIKALSATESFSIRVLSPNILPFESSLLGSIANTASLPPFLRT